MAKRGAPTGLDVARATAEAALQLVEGRDGRIMELERDNALLRAEIEALQRRLHEELERG